MFSKVFASILLNAFSRLNSSISAFTFVASLLILPLSAIATDLERYFPSSGVIKGDVMILAASPESEAISRKMQIAVAANPEWLLYYVEQAGPGLLPYHENFGITEEEYEVIINLAEGGMTLQRVGSVEITIEQQEAGGITFHVDPNNFLLHRLSISADKQYAESSFGLMERGEDIKQLNASSPTGRWSGLKWEQEKLSQDEVLREELHIGERHDYGDGILYYKATYLSDEHTETYQFVILYPLD